MARSQIAAARTAPIRTGQGVRSGDRSYEHRALPAAGLSVRKLARTAAAIVRLRQHLKPPGPDHPTAIQKGPGDAVTRSQDDRVGRIHLANSAEVLDDRADRGPLPLIEPVHGVDLREVIQRDLLDRQIGGQSDQAVNVPRIQPALARPEVVLLAHRLSLAQNTDTTGQARLAVIAAGPAPGCVPAAPHRGADPQHTL